MPRSVIVIGSGLAGLAAALRLHRAGMDVHVLDKGKSAGGRLATRRMKDGAGAEGILDYGAQYLTVRHPEFQAWVRSWEKAGVLRIWSRGFAEGHSGMKTTLEPRYRGVTGMRGIAHHLATELTVTQETRVTAVAWQDGAWEVTDGNGVVRRADALVLTAPVPQSLSLLYESRVPLPDSVVHELLHVSYWPCMALLVMLDGESGVPEPGGVWVNGEPIAWMADNRRKGISPEVTTVTIHASHTFSRGHWDEPDEHVVASLLAAAAPWLGAPVTHAGLHRWRYSRPEEGLSTPFAVVRTPGPLLLAGDAFGGGRVEGAFLSGLAAGEYLERILA